MVMRTSKIVMMVLGLAWAGMLASCDRAVKYGSKVVEWPADDQVLVVNNGGVFKPDYVAIYPRTNPEGVANVVDGFEVTFYLPAIQAYSENSYAEKTMPKVAYSIGEEFQFKFVLGGLCFPFLGNGLRVTKVVLTSANIDEALWGVCTTIVSDTGKDPTSTVTNEEPGKNTLTLDCGEGVVLNDTIATYFGFAVPTGTLESGFTLEVYDGNIKTLERSTTDLGSGFIPRGTMRKMEGSIEIVSPDNTVSP